MVVKMSIETDISNELRQVGMKYMLAKDIAKIVQNRGRISFDEIVEEVKARRDSLPDPRLQFSDLDIGYAIAMAQYRLRSIKFSPIQKNLNEPWEYVPSKKHKVSE